MNRHVIPFMICVWVYSVAASYFYFNAPYFVDKLSVFGRFFLGN